MAISVIQWVWDHSQSRHGSRLVLLAIADCAHANGTAWPSVTEIKRKTGLGDRAVQAAIIDCAKLGELDVGYQLGPNGCNRYRVLMPTPADIADPPQKLRGAKSAGPRKLRGSQSRRRPAPKTPQNLHPPAESAPPQISTPTPAESADGTVIEPKPQISSTKRSGAKHESADALAAAFWDRHKSATAQSFIAVRGVIRTAIANGLPRDDVARALDRLAKEGRAISGGSITTALVQMRNPNGRAPSPLPPNVSPRDEHMYRR